METLLPLALNFVASAASSLTTSTAVGTAIELLRVGVPLAIQTAKDLTPVVKTAIDAIRGNPVATPEQLAALDVFEAQIDADYDAASAAAAAEDAAANKT